MTNGAPPRQCWPLSRGIGVFAQGSIRICWEWRERCGNLRECQTREDLIFQIGELAGQL